MRALAIARVRAANSIGSAIGSRFEEAKHPRLHGRWVDKPGQTPAPSMHHPTPKSEPVAAPAQAPEAPAERMKTREGTAEELIAGVEQLKPSLRPFVSSYPAEDYAKMNCRVFLSENGRAGYALKPDGELISVFSLDKGNGVSLMRDAIANGAKKLDCFDTYLGRQFYPQFGFKEVNRLTWDDQYAPPGWDYEKFGRPDVVFMELK